MPKRKEQAEMPIPIKPENVKISVEVPVKNIPEEKIIKIEKVGKKPKRIKKPKIKLESKLESATKSGKGDYILIITEKPQAAAKIAAALSNGKDKRISGGKGVYYYELERNNKKIIVACAVGHLFSVSEAKKTSGYPVFDIGWKPNFEVRKRDFTKNYYLEIQRLAKNASEIIVASVDYNEKVPIMENRIIKIVKIGEFIDDVLDNKKPISNIKVPCFNKKGKISFKKLKKAIRHKMSEDLYELSLEYGRKIKLTSSHNVFKYEKGKINLSKTTNLKIGNEIFCPNSLPNSNEIIKEINLLDLINVKKIKDLYISGKDVSQVMKQRVFSKERKKYPNNDLRVIINKFGVQKLKNRREKLKLSTKKASEKINLSQPLIVLWENRKRNPSLSNLGRYLKMLNLNSKSFLNKYCKIINSSFNNLLKHVYKNQYKEFSNFNRATLPLHNLKEEEIKKIKSGFIYGSKNKRNKLPIKLKLSRELVRLMGYFLAEGDINNNYRIRFSLGLRGYGHEEKIISEIEEFCKKYGLQCNHYIHKKIKHQIITIDNAVLALFFKYIFQFGNRAINKRVPLIIFNLAPELKKEFLRAYFLGDGSISERNIAFNSNSPDLINDLSYLNLQLGIIGGISKTFSKTSKSKNPTWRFTISKDLKKIKKIWEDHHKSSKVKRVKNSIDKRIKLKDLSLLKIRDIKKIKTSKKYVYDLSVEGENFIAGQGGVCCHNTDFDIEGEVIGYNIIRFIANRKDARRMKFSSLTSDELQNSYDNSLPTIEWGQAIAGETRHFLDWLYGINLSRALMHAISSTGKFRIMSIGRVQGPALHLIVEKEKQIQSFKPTPYWQVFLLVNDGKNKLEVKYTKDITKKQELDKFKDLKNKKAIAETTKSKQTITPPAPFDLTTLQTEAYKFHSVTPSSTLRVAQNLYLSGLISYPRTSSQKIPEAMQPQKILKQLSKFHSNLTKHATRMKPVEGSKSDPAHPCFTEDTKISLKDKKITFHDIVKNIRKWEYDKNKKSFHSDLDIKNICTYNHKENLFVYSDAYKIFKTPFNSKMIYFKDIKLKVTPNHPVYSINEQGIGYINAGSLKKGDYILKEDIITKEDYRIKISKIDILRSYSKKHQKQINKKTNLVIEKSYSRISNFLEKLTFKKTLVLAKIIGFCMGDGHIHFKKPTKNRENYPLVSFVGKNEDMLKLKMDIEDLGFTAYLKTSKKNSEYSYLISKNSDFGRILISLQCPYGDKVSTKFNIPKWIINSQKEIKSAFIGGLFSAELSKTRIHLKNPRDIRPFTFTQNKEESLKNSFIKYLKTLKKILLEFKIETSEIKIKRKIIRKKDNEKTIEGSFDIKNNRENLIKFLSKIKLDYCKYKEKSYRKALAYLLYREIIINKKNKLKEKAEKLEKKGYSYEEISRIIKVSKHTIKGWLYYKKSKREKHISTRDIPKFKDFNDEVPERCTPLKIKDIRKIGFRGFVYDLEIKKTHTFFADNILVHNCIMPTGIHQALSRDDEKIYNLIVKRFVSCFCDNAELENKKVEVTIDNLKFNARGMEILNTGWMEVYPVKIEEKEIKDMNGEVAIEKVSVIEKQTQPPNRYSPASIIKELEKRNLGTKCLTGDTRVVFNGELIKVKDLFNSGKSYAKENDTEIREINGKLISFLEKEKYPIITSPSFISKRKLKENESIIQIETDSSIISLTEDHLIYILRNNNIQQVKSKELKLSDNIIGIIKNLKYGKVIAGQFVFDKNFKEIKDEILHKFSQKNSRGIKKDFLPLRWSDSLAWVLGYYYGDGSYSNPKYSGSHQVYFTTTEKKALNLLKENIKNIFGIEPYSYNLGDKYKVNCNSVMSYFIAKCFPEIEGKNPLSIPNQFIGDFLRGFFDADGNVHLRPKQKTIIKNIECNSFDTPRVKITLANKELINWVSEMLKELEIENKINKNISICNGKKFDCWTILISGRDKIEKFAYKVGFSNYKEDLLYKGLKCDSWKYKVLRNSAKICLILNKNPLKTEELEKESLIQKYELRIALKRLCNLGIVSKKRYTNRNKNIYSLTDKNTYFINHCMKLLYEKNAFGIYKIPINKISKKQYLSYVYDISIEKDSPNFVIEGNLLVHNSTRASIIDTLYNRNYVKGKSIQSTELGIRLIESLEKHSPIIIDEKLTRDFEKDMESIRASKKDLDKKQEKVIKKAEETLTKISNDFKKQEKEIGKELNEANQAIFEQEKQDNNLHVKCPQCGKGEITIKYTPRFKSYFLACTNYPNCKQTFPLPSQSLIKKTDKICEYCKWPLLLRIKQGKKPWIFCPNPKCESKKELDINRETKKN